MEKLKQKYRLVNAGVNSTQHIANTVLDSTLYFIMKNIYMYLEKVCNEKKMMWRKTPQKREINSRHYVLEIEMSSEYLHKNKEYKCIYHCLCTCTEECVIIKNVGLYENKVNCLIMIKL